MDVVGLSDGLEVVGDTEGAETVGVLVGVENVGLTVGVEKVGVRVGTLVVGLRDGEAEGFLLGLEVPPLHAHKTYRICAHVVTYQNTDSFPIAPFSQGVDVVHPRHVAFGYAVPVASIPLHLGLK